MQKKITILILLLLTPFMIVAEETTGINRRLFDYEEPRNDLVSLSFSNPSLRIYEHRVSLSSVFCTFHQERESEAIDAQKGEGNRYLEGGARSYIRQDNSAIWGHARYTIGKEFNLQFNESSDAELIYPYFTADSIGGDRKMEKYSLEGGYACKRNRWQFGVDLGYDAAIYFRNTDPRPKNVTGLAKLTIGAAYKVTDNYTCGISVNAQKYKQTCDIMFVGETGKTEIFHLKGLGNRYERFSGTSEKSFYTGSRIGGSITLFPANRRGFVATAAVTRFRFRKILTDLNKLPLCRAWHNEINAEAGYLSGKWGATAHFKGYRRHGIENIFGDPSAGVYPMIGSLLMYADNSFLLGASGNYQIDLSADNKIDLLVGIDYTHRSSVYAEPMNESMRNDAICRYKLRYRGILANVWNMNAAIAATHLISEYLACGITFQAMRALTSKYGIGLEASYTYCHRNDGIQANRFNVSASFIF